MATAGSAEHPGRPTRSCPGGTGPGGGVRTGGNGSRTGGTGSRTGGTGTGAWRGPGAEERPRRRSDPDRGGGARREVFVLPALLPKSSEVQSGPAGRPKLLGLEDEARRRNPVLCESGPALRDPEPGVLSDSENEEPITRKIRTISAFIRKTKTSSAISSGCQRSRSCTDPLEDRGGKQKATALERVCPVSAGGVLLAWENSRSVSAPITGPDRRPAWRAVLTRSTVPPVPPVPSVPVLTRPERSVSPESNDSISEELNHFKPIVCSPCTPPRRGADGRLAAPPIVKATPRNLRNLRTGSGPEPEPEPGRALLQRWRQVELDRLAAASKATLTSPVGAVATATRRRRHRAPGAVAAATKRRRLFEPPDGADPVRTWRPGSPDGIRMGTEQIPGEKSRQKTKHLDPDLDPGRVLDPGRAWAGSGARARSKSGSRSGSKSGSRSRSRSGSRLCQIQQDRALALKLQRQFDRESRTRTGTVTGTGTGTRTGTRTGTSPDVYLLRSWRSNQNRRGRRGLRRSRRISQKL
ncbi:uncharacterized protein ACNS7B_015280 isoform 2-T2 [Menidia menidia]